MGTDIHLYVERRDAATGTWRCVPPPAPPPASERTEVRSNGELSTTYVSPFWGPGKCMHASPCYGPYGRDEEKCLGESCPACLGTGRDLRWYHNRNYDAFAILTGTVRNGHGFAGVPTGDGFRGITDKPRGVPDDVSAVVRDHNLWDHSSSWFLLPEVTGFDWDQVTRHCGVVPMRVCDGSVFDKDGGSTYEVWRQSPPAEPSSYSGGIWAPGIKTVTPEDADAMLASPELLARMSANGDKFYVRVGWTETYRESASDFLEFVDQMLVPLGNPEDTRIVFGFDS